MRMWRKIGLIRKSLRGKVIFLSSIKCLFKTKKTIISRVIKRVSIKDWVKPKRTRLKLSKITTNKNLVLPQTKILKSLMLLISPEMFTPRLEIITVVFCIIKGLPKMIFFFLKLMVTSGLLPSAIKALRKILFKHMECQALH